MEFKFSVNEVFRQPYAKIGCNLAPPGFTGDRRAFWDTVGKVSEVVNAMGESSAAAQGLTKPITTAERLRNSEHCVYLLIDQNAANGRGAVTGMLKTGKKGLYVFDRNGQHYQVSPPCVLDFYIHESRQRTGLGKRLFEHMLQDEKITPVKMAIDRPSDKFLGFLNKHYCLNSPVKQMNNYVVFDGFFPGSPERNGAGDLDHSICSPGKKQAANGLQASNYASPLGRYGAPRPACSMGQIIHNQTSTIPKNTEPTGAQCVRSTPATNYHCSPSYNSPGCPALTQSAPNVYYRPQCRLDGLGPNTVQTNYCDQQIQQNCTEQPTTQYVQHRPQPSATPCVQDCPQQPTTQCVQSCPQPPATPCVQNCSQQPTVQCVSYCPQPPATQCVPYCPQPLAPPQSVQYSPRCTPVQCPCNSCNQQSKPSDGEEEKTKSTPPDNQGYSAGATPSNNQGYGASATPPDNQGYSAKEENGEQYYAQSNAKEPVVTPDEKIPPVSNPPPQPPCQRASCGCEPQPTYRQSSDQHSCQLQCLLHNSGYNYKQNHTCPSHNRPNHGQPYYPVPHITLFHTVPSNNGTSPQTQGTGQYATHPNVQYAGDSDGTQNMIDSNGQQHQSVVNTSTNEQQSTPNIHHPAGIQSMVNSSATGQASNANVAMNNQLSQPNMANQGPQMPNQPPFQGNVASANQARSQSHVVNDGNTHENTQQNVTPLTTHLTLSQPGMINASRTQNMPQESISQSGMASNLNERYAKVRNVNTIPSGPQNVIQQPARMAERLNTINGTSQNQPVCGTHGDTGVLKETNPLQYGYPPQADKPAQIASQ